MSSSRFFFLGFAVDEDLRARLDGCASAESAFLSSPDYLEQVILDGITWVGRRLTQDAVSPSDVEDSARNVVSLIARVAPGWRRNASSATLLSLEETVRGTDLLVGD